MTKEELVRENALLHNALENIQELISDVLGTDEEDEVEEIEE